jgi:HSP20 family protein
VRAFTRRQDDEQSVDVGSVARHAALAARDDVPGLDPDELHVSTSGRQLIVRDERAEERGGERRYEAFVRTVMLPPGLDIDDGEARVRNGVLTVRFPKADARDGSRRIPVRT